VYRRPASLSVARFIGQLNEVPGEVESAAGDTCVVRTPLGPVHAHAGSGLQPGAKVILGVRPEDVHLVPADQVGAVNRWTGTVTMPVFLGTRNEHLVSVQGTDFKVSSRGELLDMDSTVCVAVDASCILVFPETADTPSADEELGL
jgi:ABC-type Fe3+/spermidine/putrescine transport system ATPase subunit